MREIMFRGWDGEKMLDDIDIISGEGTYCESLNGECERTVCCESIMQYTGMKDENGVEVYEGDVVTVINYLEGKPWKGHIHPCEVVSIPGGWGLKDHWNHESLCSLCIEVIGNIHENPELLITESPTISQANE